MNEFSFPVLDALYEVWSRSTRPKQRELAADAMFFDRELITILPGLYEARRPEFSGRALFPIIPVADQDADDIRVQGVSYFGRGAKGRVGWKNDKGVPVIAAQRFEDTARVGAYKVGVQFEDRLLRRWRSLGLPIEQGEMDEAFRELRRLENEAIWNGDTEQGIVGVLSSSGGAATTALPSGVAWDDPAVTSANIYQDLLHMGQYVASTSTYVYQDRVTILMPWEAYQAAASRQYAAGTDTNVLNYFLNNAGSRWVADIVPVRELDVAKKAISFVRSERLAGILSVRDVFQYEPQRYSGGYSIDMEINTGGFKIIDSNSIHAFSGILT
jgi:hypothetical protein